MFIDTRNLEKDHKILLSKMDNLLSKLNTNAKTPINRKDLEQFPSFEWLFVDKEERGGFQKRNNHFDNYLNFDLKMKQKGRINKHFHEDIIESIDVIKGRVIDLETAKIHNEGDVIVYQPGEKHDLYAIKDSELKVLCKDKL